MWKFLNLIVSNCQSVGEDRTGDMARDRGVFHHFGHTPHRETSGLQVCHWQLMVFKIVKAQLSLMDTAHKYVHQTTFLQSGQHYQFQNAQTKSAAT